MSPRTSPAITGRTTRRTPVQRGVALLAAALLAIGALGACGGSSDGPIINSGSGEIVPGGD